MARLFTYIVTLGSLLVLSAYITVPTQANSYLSADSVALLPTVQRPTQLSASDVLVWGTNTSNIHNMPWQATSDIAQISVNHHHVLALNTLGRVIGWGQNSKGELTIPPQAQRNVVAVATGTYHSVALKSDGTIVMWGAQSTQAGGSIPTDVAQIAAGDAYTAFLHTNGLISVRGDAALRTLPVQLSAPAVSVAIAAGATSALALLDTGEIVQWGTTLTPPVSARTNNVAIFAHGDTYAALNQNGDLIVWGASLNLLGTILPANTTRSSDSTCGCDYLRITNLASMQSLEVSASGIGIVKRTGYVSWLLFTGATIPAFPDATARVHTLGVHPTHNTGVALRMTNSQLVAPTVTPHIRINTNTTDKFHSAGAVIGWGSNSLLTTIPAVASDEVIQVVAGRAHALALKVDGSVVAWGDDSNGQVTVPLDLRVARPHGDRLRIMAVAAGAYHSLALRANGTVVAWGSNSHKQSTVPNLPPVIQIAAGSRHSLALLTNGEIRAWGDNSYGQTSIPQFTGIQKIIAGANHNLAILANGKAYAWGRNHAGQLNIDSSLFVSDIAANENNSVLLQTNGQIVVYGDNSYQQYDSPAVRVQRLSTASNHLFAIGIDGQSYAWGFNSDGQTDIPSLGARAFMLAGGNNFSLALVPNTTGFSNQIPTIVPTSAANQAYFTDIDASGFINIGYQHEQFFMWGKYQPRIPPQYVGNILVIEQMLIPQQFVAITTAGELIQWGSNPITITADLTVPHAYTDPTRPIDVECGFNFCLVLTKGSTVRIVGSPNTNNTCLATFPDGISNIAKISVSDTMFTLLDTNNIVTVWGCHTDAGNTPPTLPADWQNARDIADSVNFGVILKPNNSVQVYDKYSHLDYILDTKLSVPVRSIHIFEVRKSIFVLYVDGTVERFTFNGSFSKKSYPYTDIIAIATGWTQYLLLHEDGSIESWDTCNIEDDCRGGLAGLPPTTNYTFPASQITNHQGRFNLWSCQPTNPNECVTHTTEQITNASLSQSTEPSVYDTAVTFAGDSEPQFFNYSHIQYTVPITNTSYQKILIGPKDTSQRQLQAFLTTNHEFYIDNSLGDYPLLYESIPSFYKTNVADFDISGTHIVIQHISGMVWSSIFGELPSSQLVRRIAAGPLFVVVLYVDGSVQVWDNEHQNGIDFVPPRATNIIAIDAGLHHVVALRQDGQVIAWGAEVADLGQADVPYTAQQRIIAVAAGNTFSVALNDSGQLVLWGEYPPVFDSINESMRTAGRMITTLFTGGNSLATLSRVTATMPTALPTATVMRIPTQTPRPIIGDITRNLIASFDFNTQMTTQTYSGVGGNMTCVATNCPQMSSESIDGYALAFDNRYGAELISSNPLTLVNTSFTVSTWFKRRQLHRNDPIITFGTPNKVNEYFSLGINNNNRVYCSFYGNDLVSNVVYNDTAWHQYACTFNASSMIRRLYRDGLVIAIDQVAMPLIIKSSPLVIGRNNTTADAADGWIDNVAIYARELTSQLTTYADFPANNPVMQFSFNQLNFASQSARTFTLACTSQNTCPSWRRSTHNNHAVQFNGGQSLTIAGNPNTKGGFSLLYWAKANQYGTTETIVVSQEDKLRMGFTAAKVPYCAVGNQTLTVGTFSDIYNWHHYACTYDAKTKRIALAIDGMSMQSTSAVIFSSVAPLWIGTLVSGSKGFIGQVDDFMLYDRALSITELRRVYEITNPNPTYITPTVPVVSYTASPTFTTTKSPTITATYRRTKTAFPSTATIKVAPYRSPTFTASVTFTRTATATALPSKTPLPSRTLQIPSATLTRMTATPTRTAQFITRTIIAQRSATAAATYISQTQTATVVQATQTAISARTQTVQAIETQYAYPLPAAQSNVTMHTTTRTRTTSVSDARPTTISSTATMTVTTTP